MAVLRRRWLLLVCSPILGALIGVAILSLAPVSYSATTSVLAQPTGADTNSTNGRTSTEINLDTEAQLVRSSVVAQLAVEALGLDTSPRELVSDVSVGVPPNTSVLSITFTADSAEAARDGSAALAKAYLDNRRAVAEGQIKARVEGIRARIATLDAELAENARALRKLPSSADRTLLATQRDLLVQQLQTSSQELNPLTSASVDPGSVITEAQLPTNPTGVSAPIVMTTAVFASLMLGLGVAYARDTRDKRIRSPRDLARLDMDVIVGKFALTMPGETLGIRQRDAEQLRQVRNALLAVIPKHRGSLTVASATPGDTGAVMSTCLASALARSGVETILVSVSIHNDVVTEHFGLADETGLADVLNTGCPLIDSVHPVAGIPGLSVVPPGLDRVRFSELLQDATFGPMLHQLESLADVVVLDVAPTSVNADAQTIVPATTGLLLVTTAGVSTTDEVLDAVSQLRHVGASVLGTVIVESPHRQLLPPFARTLSRAETKPARATVASSEAEARVASGERGRRLHALPTDGVDPSNDRIA
nr:polysaccharide biosynthesis tyrosine autokinase [Nocardioides daedukensis]